MYKIIGALTVALLCFAGAIGINLLITYVAMVMYNGLAPVFHLPLLTYWQVWSVMFLFGLIGSCFKASLQVKKE